MAIRVLKSNTNGQRNSSYLNSSEITKTTTRLFSGVVFVISSLFIIFAPIET